MENLLLNTFYVLQYSSSINLLTFRCFVYSKELPSFFSFTFSFKQVFGYPQTKDPYWVTFICPILVKDFMQFHSNLIFIFSVREELKFVWKQVLESLNRTMTKIFLGDCLKLLDQFHSLHNPWVLPLDLKFDPFSC